MIGRTEDDAVIVRMEGWRAVRDLKLDHPLKAFDAWNELWLGAAAAHDRFLQVETNREFGRRGWEISWEISSRPSPTA